MVNVVAVACVILYMIMVLEPCTLPSGDNISIYVALSWGVSSGTRFSAWRVLRCPGGSFGTRFSDLAPGWGHYLACLHVYTRSHAFLWKTRGKRGSGGMRYSMHDHGGKSPVHYNLGTTSPYI